jgi:hypothetical protein
VEQDYWLSDGDGTVAFCSATDNIGAEINFSNPSRHGFSARPKARCHQCRRHAASANLPGIVAPALIGWSKDLTGGFVAAMLGLAAMFFVAGALSLIFRPRIPVGVGTVRA